MPRDPRWEASYWAESESWTDVPETDPRCRVKVPEEAERVLVHVRKSDRALVVSDGETPAEDAGVIVDWGYMEHDE